MIESTPSLAVEGEAVKRAYAALNRNDISAMVEAFDTNVEWIEPPDFSTPGPHRGLEAVRAHVSEARATWAEGGCEPERLLVAGDRIIAFIKVHVRLKVESDWRDGSVTDVFTFRDGKVVQVRTFGEREQALEWAGAESSAAN